MSHNTNDRDICVCVGLFGSLININDSFTLPGAVISGRMWL